MYMATDCANVMALCAKRTTSNCTIAHRVRTKQGRLSALKPSSGEGVLSVLSTTMILMRTKTMMETWLVTHVAILLSLYIFNEGNWCGVRHFCFNMIFQQSLTFYIDAWQAIQVMFQRCMLWFKTKKTPKLKQTSSTQTELNKTQTRFLKWTPERLPCCDLSPLGAQKSVLGQTTSDPPWKIALSSLLFSQNET